jgi:hypothetical protein
VLCIITFGIEPPDQMLIGVLLPLGGLEDIRVDVEYDGNTTAYTCRPSAEFQRTFYCTGPQIPLGSTVRIQISIGNRMVPVASGEFVLTAFALPTVSVGVPPVVATAYPNPLIPSP